MVVFKGLQDRFDVNRFQPVFAEDLGDLLALDVGEGEDLGFLAVSSR